MLQSGIESSPSDIIVVIMGECIILSDCVGSYFPEFQRVALEMIKAQGGIFGWVTNSREAIAPLQ
jgi:hypothetical protein